MSKKPDFTLPPLSGDNDLLTRLNTFLPQLSAANESLAAEIAAGNADAKNIEHVDEEEERYIEMVRASASERFSHVWRLTSHRT
jgi:hypothetical protein